MQSHLNLRLRPALPARAGAACRAAATSTLQLPPGSTGWPILGETIQFLTDKDDVWHQTRKAKYGSIYRTNLLFKPTVMVDDPPEVIRLLTTDADQVEAAYPKGVSEMLGPSSVSVATGTQHAKLRQTLNAGFSNAAMATYLPGMLDLFSKQLATWPAQISLLGRCKTMIFDATTSVLLGFDVDPELKERTRRLNTTIGAGFFTIPSPLVPDYRRALAARKELIQITAEFVAALKAAPPLAPGKRGKTALQLLLAARDEEGNALSDSELEDLTNNLFFAATETTAFTFSQLMSKTADRPDIVERLRQEQRELVAQHGEAITAEVLDSMTYSEAVLLEALRYRSPVPAVFRAAKQDMQVSNEQGSYLVPEGTTLLLRMMQGHAEEHDESWKQYGTAFEPDRWFDEQGAIRKPPASFQPFGAGPRMCLGWRLAKLEGKILLALLARHCRWENVEPGKELFVSVTGNNDDVLLTKFWYSEESLL